VEMLKIFANWYAMSQTVTVQVPCSPGHLLPTSHLCPCMASFSSHSTRLALEIVPGRERERRGGGRRERERRGGRRREREKGGGRREREGEEEGGREKGNEEEGKEGKAEELLISFITTDCDLLAKENHLAVVPIQKFECFKHLEYFLLGDIGFVSIRGDGTEGAHNFRHGLHILSLATDHE